MTDRKKYQREYYLKNRNKLLERNKNNYRKNILNPSKSNPKNNIDNFKVIKKSIILSFD